MVLHTAGVVRNRSGFEHLSDVGERQRFYSGLTALLSRLPFTVIACAIDKPALLDRYGALAVDPYA